jgi:hypothetical protein
LRKKPHDRCRVFSQFGSGSVTGFSGYGAQRHSHVGFFSLNFNPTTTNIDLVKKL